MTIPRSKQVDPDVTRWYHCISRCVRKANLLGDGGDGKPGSGPLGDRKLWIQNRLQELSEIFAVAVAGFAALDNHLHVLLRLDPDKVPSWSDKEVLQRWHRLYPPHHPDGTPLTGEKLDQLEQKRLKDANWLAQRRERLGSLSWFMRCLKEPLARLVNQEEECTGHFFEGRFKSIAILDDEALLSVCAYIDLNPVAAGISATPEESRYTSVKARVDHVHRQQREQDLQAARQGSVAGSQAAKDLEESLWLIPIEDRRHLDSQREGMFPSFTLGNYLMLVEYTGRLLRDGKATISAEVSDILERIGSSATVWQIRLERLSQGRLTGRCLASTRARLREAAACLGVSRLANLNAAPAA